MAERDWFRKPTWLAADEADFRARLARARKPNRAQYLRIQAVTLREQGDAALLPAALGLLDELVRDFPEDLFLAWANQCRGECLIDLGRLDEAIVALREGLQAEGARPQVVSGSAITFAELVLSLKRTALYPEARAHLSAMGEQVTPDARYAVAACRALLADAAGDSDEAAAQARLALAAADAGPPFRRHKTVGVVKVVDPDVHARLRRLSGT